MLKFLAICIITAAISMGLAAQEKSTEMNVGKTVAADTSGMCKHAKEKPCLKSETQERKECQKNCLSTCTHEQGKPCSEECKKKCEEECMKKCKKSEMKEGVEQEEETKEEKSDKQS